MQPHPAPVDEDDAAVDVDVGVAALVHLLALVEPNKETIAS